MAILLIGKMLNSIFIKIQHRFHYNYIYIISRQKDRLQSLNQIIPLDVDLIQSYRVPLKYIRGGEHIYVHVRTCIYICTKPYIRYSTSYGAAFQDPAACTTTKDDKAFAGQPEEGGSGGRGPFSRNDVKPYPRVRHRIRKMQFYQLWDTAVRDWHCPLHPKSILHAHFWCMRHARQRISAVFDFISVYSQLIIYRHLPQK